VHAKVVFAVVLAVFSTSEDQAWQPWAGAGAENAPANKCPCPPFSVLPSVNSGQQQNPAQQSAKGSAAEKDEWKWHGWWKDPTTAATVFIAIFNLILMAATIGLYKVTRHAANAAKESADSLKASERGWIKDKKRLKEVRNYTDSNGHHGPKITFQWHNVGRSPCTITEEVNCVAVVPAKNGKPQMPDIPDYSLGTPNFSRRMIEPNDFIYAVAKLKDPITAKQDGHMATKYALTVTYGYVKYLDVFGTPHETAYLWYWKMTRNDWRQGDDPKYVRQT
jgi:hypothetical protein